MTVKKLPQKNLIVLIGASGTGKSNLASKIHRQISEQLGQRSVTIVSSDEIRKGLVGEDIDQRSSDIMMEYSKQAFELLEKQIIANMTFPVSKDYIIVDTTGLNKDFRYKMMDLARDYHYNITGILIHLNKEDMETLAEKSSFPALTRKHHLRITKEVLPALKKKAYKDFFTLKSLDELDTFQVQAEKDPYIFNVGNENVAIIGDVHEQNIALNNILKELQNKHDVKLENTFLVGDYVDKNNNTLETISLVYDLYKKGLKIVKANHENYVYKRLFQGLEDTYGVDHKFSSLAVLQHNEQLATKFCELFENSLPYAHIVRDKGKRIFVTHAPCENKYLGKSDQKSCREQRQFRYTGLDQTQLLERLSYLKTDSDTCYPFHIFGHIPQEQVGIYKNKINVDTSGKGLTAVVFKGDNPDKYEFINVEGLAQEKTYMSWIPQEKKKTFLDPRQQGFVDWFIKRDVKYISGTMAPAPSDRQENDIESLELGLKSFDGCPAIVLQPKEMGSRAQFYMFKDDIEKCFFVTRNGHVIRRSKPEEKEALDTLVKNTYEKYNALVSYKKSVILDGELLPWSYLGSGLIEDTFKPIEACLEYATNFFNDTNYRNRGGDELVNKEFQVYSDQLKNFGSYEDPYYKAFSILSIDGQEVYTKMSQYATSQQLEFGDCLLVTKDTPKSDIVTFFEYYTIKKGYEGIVVKPDIYSEEYLPYLKIRNKKYLTLVYGPEYLSPTSYTKLVQKKRTDKKAQLSKKEFDLGIQMLRAKSEDELRELVASMLGCLEHEKGLDPRL